MERQCDTVCQTLFGVFLQRKCRLIMKKHADLWHMSRNWSLEMVHTTCHKFNFEFWQPPNIVQFDQEERGMLTKRNPAASAASIGSITDGWWFPKRSWVLTPSQPPAQKSDEFKLPTFFGFVQDDDINLNLWKTKHLKKSVISCSSQEKSDQTPNHRTDIPIFAYLHQMAAGSLQGMGMGCGQLHVVPHIRGAERLQGHRALSRLNVHRDAQMDTGPAPGKLGGKSHHVLDGKVMESHGALKTGRWT